MKFWFIFLLCIFNSQFLLAYSNGKNINNTKIVNMSNYKIQGIYLQVWNMVFKEFLNNSNIPENKKILKYYIVTISESNNQYIVDFSPILAEIISGNKIIKGGSTPHTKSIAYWVDKKTMSVIKYNFFK